jgi:gamma-glutamylcyclotransferase (GGCT)/AIG2-like uncharacterized protein YtfP
MSAYLFVYGTLRPECPRPPLTELRARLTHVGPGAFPGRLYDLGPYPAAVYDAASDSSVHGHIFQLPTDDKTLEQLDDYEGYIPRCPAESLFIREAKTVTLASGGELQCWVYLHQQIPAGASEIFGGDYGDWLAR